MWIWIEEGGRDQQGIAPIFERGLEPLLKRNIGTRLRASTDLESAVLGAELSLIAVGTPFDGREIDLTYVRDVAREIGGALRDRDGYHVVVVKSTVVPGTTDDVVLPILEEASGKKAGVDFGVGMNPEFLTEGEAVSDFMIPTDRPGRPGRGDHRRARAALRGLRGGAARSHQQQDRGDDQYTSNSLLAAMISFSNELGTCARRSAMWTGGRDGGVHLSRYLTTRMSDGALVSPGILSFLAAAAVSAGAASRRTSTP